MAAAYDHVIVTRAHGAGHHVAFCAIESDVILDETRGRDLERTLETIPGVDHGSVKISVPTAALSFAFDPARVAPNVVLDAVNVELAGKGLALVPLRVIEPLLGAR